MVFMVQAPVMGSIQPLQWQQILCRKSHGSLALAFLNGCLVNSLNHASLHTSRNGTNSSSSLVLKSPLHMDVSETWWHTP